jgi:hypothetical protein
MTASTLIPLVIWLLVVLLAIYLLAVMAVDSLIAPRHRPPMVPWRERQDFSQAAIIAVALAHKGQATEGYGHLLAARRRFLAECNSDEPWVDELARLYQRTLDRYVGDHLTE